MTTKPKTTEEENYFKDEAITARVKQIADRIGTLESGSSNNPKLLALTADLLGEVEGKMALYAKDRAPNEDRLFESTEKLFGRLLALLESEATKKGERGFANAEALVELTVQMCWAVHHIWLRRDTRVRINTIANNRINFPILISNELGESLDLTGSHWDFHRMTNSLKLQPPLRIGRTNRPDSKSKLLGKNETPSKSEQPKSKPAGKSPEVDPTAIVNLRATIEPWVDFFLMTIRDQKSLSNDRIAQERRRRLMSPRNRWNATVWKQEFIKFAKTIPSIVEEMYPPEIGKKPVSPFVEVSSKTMSLLEARVERRVEPGELEQLRKAISFPSPRSAALHYWREREDEKQLWTSLGRAAFAVLSPSLKKQKAAQARSAKR